MSYPGTRPSLGSRCLRWDGTGWPRPRWALVDGLESAHSWLPGRSELWSLHAGPFSDLPPRGAWSWMGTRMSPGALHCSGEPRQTPRPPVCQQVADPSPDLQTLQSSHSNIPCLVPSQRLKGFPGGSDSKESACNAGDWGLIPGLERSLEERNGDPLEYSCLENSMNRGAWWATVHEVAKRRP